jgi:hypothetical protein
MRADEQSLSATRSAIKTDVVHEQRTASMTNPSPAGHPEYFTKYKNFALSRSASGVLTLRFHTDGGPHGFDGTTHHDLPRLLEDIAFDSANRVLVLTGTGDSFIPSIDGPSLGDLTKAARTPCQSRPRCQALAAHSALPAPASDQALSKPAADWAEAGEIIRNVDERVKARENRAPGRVVRINLGDGRCAYGRQLLSVSVEFYDRLGKAGETASLSDVVASPVVFTVSVMDYAFRQHEGWDLLDVVPLPDEKRAAVERWAKKDVISGALSIYWEDHATGTYGETPASLEECEGLEIAAVWDPEHVEDRLRDHFDGRPNRWVESMRLK